MESVSRRRLLGVLAGASVGLLAGWRSWGTRAVGSGSPSSTAGPVAVAPTTTLPEPVTTISRPAAPIASPSTTATETTSASIAEAETTTTVAVVPGVGALTVIERSAWGAKPAAGAYTDHVVGKLTVHHTAAAARDVAGAPARMRGYQSFHQGDKGWEDLAYHFIIDGGGNVYEGRPVTAAGDTATSYDPTGHFLPCLDGNFDEAEPSQAQLSALVRLLAWAAAAFGVDPLEVGSHRDYAGTSCPGANVFSRLDGIRVGVAAALGQGGVELVYLRGQDGIDRVSAIEAG